MFGNFGFQKEFRFVVASKSVSITRPTGHYPTNTSM